MPAVVALAIRALIQITVTLGLITLAEKYVLPLINRAIAAIMEVFDVSEKDAKDIMSNEILLFAEQVGIGILLLRAKIPTSIAEKLGFTSKGWKLRPLTGKAATVRSGTTASGIIVPGGTIIPTIAETSGILLKAKSVLPGFATAFNVLAKTLGLTFLGFIAFNNLVDFGNWNSGAYQKTFQRIFAKITGGLLVPDEDYRKTKTVSPAVFDKVYNTYKLEGVIGINDPYKRQSLVFSRDNLIDLLDIVGADLLRTTQRASTKSVLLASQLFMIFAESKEAPTAIAVKTAAAATPKIKVFTGVLTQGKLGEVDPFIARETDLIDSMEELQTAAQNNLANFIMALPGRIIYEIKIVSSITTKDGFIQRGTRQQIISGYTTAGAPKFRTVINKFATIAIYVFTERNIRTKIQTIVLGPVDSVAFQPKTNEIQLAEQSIKANLITSDISEIQTIKTENDIEIKMPAIAETNYINIETIITGIGRIADLDTWNQIPNGALVEIGSLEGLENYRNLFVKGGRTLFETKSANTAGKNVYRLNFSPQTILRFGAILPDGASQIVSEKNTYATAEAAMASFIAGPQVTLPVTAIPTSNNPNRCLTATIAEFFDVNRMVYPTVAERSKLYETFDLGLANWYTGTAEQNIKLLKELKSRSAC